MSLADELATPLIVMVGRVFWVYHDKFPSQGRRLLDSLDVLTQKHLNDEQAVMAKLSSNAEWVWHYVVIHYFNFFFISMFLSRKTSTLSDGEFINEHCVATDFSPIAIRSASS